MTERIDGDLLDELDPDLRTLVDDTRSCDADDPAFGTEASGRVLDEVRRTVREPVSRPNAPGLVAPKASLLRSGVVLASACIIVAFAGSRMLLDEGESTSTSSAPARAIARPADTPSSPPETNPTGEGVPMMRVDNLPSSASAVAPSPSVVRSASPSKAQPEGTDLAEEYRLIEAGRAGLAAGDYAKALQSLREHEARFPNGQLNQQCESLHIQVLVEAGRITEARERARTFQARFPGGLLMPSVARAIASSSSGSAKP